MCPGFQVTRPDGSSFWWPFGESYEEADAASRPAKPQADAPVTVRAGGKVWCVVRGHVTKDELGVRLSGVPLDPGDSLVMEDEGRGESYVVVSRDGPDVYAVLSI
jgi:hypothetical protein